MTARTPRSPGPVPGGGLAVAGTATIIAGGALVVALHVVDPGLDPLRSTISEYALGRSRWMFDTAVFVLSAGSLVVLLAALRDGLVRARSAPAALLAVWGAALVLIGVSPMDGPGLPLTLGGVLHGGASVAAFSALPVAVLLIGRDWCGHARWGRDARWVTVPAWAVLLWLVPLVPVVIGLVSQPGGSGLSAVVPFGLIQRGLAVTEVTALVALGAWVSRVGRSLQTHSARTDARSDDSS